MKTSSKPSSRSCAPAPLASNRRLQSLGLACLTSFTLLAPAASAAVTITEDANNSGACVLRSGVWVASGRGADKILDRFGDFYGDSGVGEGFFYLVVEFGVDGLSVDGYVDAFAVPSSDSFLSVFVTPVSFSLSAVDGDFTLVVDGGFTGTGGTAGGGFWSGTYRVTACEPPTGVPDGGGSLALFACGLGAVGGVRRVIAKRQRA